MCTAEDYFVIVSRYFPYSTLEITLPTPFVPYKRKLIQNVIYIDGLLPDSDFGEVNIAEDKLV